MGTQQRPNAAPPVADAGGGAVLPSWVRACTVRPQGVLGEHLPGVLRATTDLLQPVRTTCQPADRRVGATQ